MKSKFQSRRSGGFSLIEILVALAILTMLAFLASMAFDGSRTKAQAMIALSKQLSDGAIQMRVDTGCYPVTPDVLFDSTIVATTAKNRCSKDLSRTWARPYLARYVVNAGGAILADKISAGALASFGTQASGTRTRHFVAFTEIPAEVVRQALIECNGAEADRSDFNASRCKGVAASGTFDVMFDETR